ncbi:MAG: hypothetical protein KBS76_04450, partial [Ruminococcus sp.]|nr:hypothetical protein [Candidatus Apopatosoma intestinale]
MTAILTKIVIVGGEIGIARKAVKFAGFAIKSELLFSAFGALIYWEITPFFSAPIRTDSEFIFD